MTTLKAGLKYQLHQDTLPRVRAEDGRVVVRLELSSTVDPTDRPDIELVFGADIAFDLAEEIRRASASTRANE